MTKRSIFTTAVHAGERSRERDYTPTVTPIHNAVGYVYDSMEDLEGVFAHTRAGYVYARFGNPTNQALEQALAALEGGDDAVVFASGMAALHATFIAAGLRQGSHVLASQDLYGATYHMLARHFANYGVTVHFCDMTDLATVHHMLAEHQPQAVVMEVISNPLLKVVDSVAIAEMAHECDATVIVDSTFTTPYLLQPLTNGADYVVHSTTKYLSGHGDALGGAVTGSAERMNGVRTALRELGANLGPNEAYLTLRGLKTFPLRMRQQCANAVQIARWLATHKRVARVNYPGLPDHPTYETARRIFGDRGYGGMVSFELANGDQEMVFRFFDALKLVQPATTLGDVFSLVLYPMHASHRSMTAKERAVAQITPKLVRMSVGIEDTGDIVADMDQALASLG